MSSGTLRIERLALIGCGLMGGSLALALKRAGVVQTVVASSRNAHTTARALALGVIDEAANSHAQAVAGADVVVLALPVAATQSALEALLPALSPQALVTDVGSTKRDVVKAARAAMGSRVGQFVPAHPIAGKESAGVEHACADLYDHRRHFLTPLQENSREWVQRAYDLWAATGAQVSELSPEVHDHTFAAVSHTPHLLAFAFMNGLLDQGDAARFLALAGPGFRDFTRIAGGDPTVWRDILLANRDEVLAQLTHFDRSLAALRHSLQSVDAAALEAQMAQAARARQAWTLNTDPWLDQDL